MFLIGNSSQHYLEDREVLSAVINHPLRVRVQESGLSKEANLEGYSPFGYIDITPHFGEVDMSYVDILEDQNILLRFRNRMPYHLNLNHVFSDKSVFTTFLQEMYPGHNLTRQIYSENMEHPECLPTDMKIEYEDITMYLKHG